MRIRVHASTRAHIRAGVRSRVRGRARALPGSIRNPYGFRFKPIRVSFQTRTGFKQTLYGFSKCGVWNVECGMALTRQVEARQEVKLLSKFRNYEISKLRACRGKCREVIQPDAIEMSFRRK